MKHYIQLAICLAIAWIILPVAAGAQEKDRVKGDSGFGFALSTNGQSLFYTRGTNPFRTHHRYPQHPHRRERPGRRQRPRRRQRLFRAAWTSSSQILRSPNWSRIRSAMKLPCATAALYQSTGQM